jgi:transcriptional regulator with XRE-family HTH domain
MWTNAYSTRDVGRHLARLRRAQGKTQAEFARSLGVHRSTLSSLENGGPVSSELMVRAISLLGSRIVIAPKPDRVSVESDA